LYLVENTKPQDAMEEGEPEGVVFRRFMLDTVIKDKGSNLSVGQCLLISLAWALVKDFVRATLRPDASCR
jgi:ABC-type multidrug transport system fused ATPase/permease subunit